MPTDKSPAQVADEALASAMRATDRLAKVARFLGNAPMHREFEADYLKARADLERDISRAVIAAKVAIAEEFRCANSHAVEMLIHDRLRRELDAMDKEGANGK